MMRTLVLTNGYEPINTTSWRRALKMLTLGKCEVIEVYEHEVRTSHLVIKAPAVIRLVNAISRRKQRVKYGKLSIFARDRWICQYCGSKAGTEDLTRDHVLPRAQGGKSCWENVVTACRGCNSKKANRTPQQAGLRLRQQPVKPAWVPLLTIRIGKGGLPAIWKQYVPV
jgi:5-methylcytosine-specific restriction endonuclease McrA